jgi:hypothetical protein
VVTDVVLEPIAIAASPDSEGRLVFFDERLAAILVRLDDEEHGEDRGGWFLEAAFGVLSDISGDAVFGTLEEAADWLHRALGGESVAPRRACST